MYRSVFEESNGKRKMNEAVVFSISTIDDAFEAIQKCVALIIEKKKSSMAMMLPRIAEAVMNGIKDALGNIYSDPNKIESVKKQIVAKFIRFFKQDAVSAPEEPMM
jgi:hypothetical protein